MHQAAIRSLGLVEDRLRKHSPERKATYHKGKGKENFKHQPSQSQTSESSGDEQCRARREDARNIIAQARVKNTCYAWKEENYENDEKEMGALCFTQRVRRMRVPKGFKLPHDQQNMMGHKNPDYGYQTTNKQYKYSEEREQRRCKACSYTSPARRDLG
jgi:hypothetical protein